MQDTKELQRLERKAHGAYITAIQDKMSADEISKRLSVWNRAVSALPVNANAAPKILSKHTRATAAPKRSPKEEAPHKRRRATEPQPGMLDLGL